MVFRYILLAAGCSAYLIGTLLGLGGVGGSGIALGLAVLCGLVATVRRRWAVALAAWTLAAGLLGIGHGQASYADRQTLERLVGSRVTVYAQVADDPVITTKSTVLTLQNLVVDGGPSQQTISLRTYALRVQRGYHLELAGKLGPGFGTAAAELFYPKLLATDAHQSWLEQWRQRFFAGVRTALPEPIGSFVLGLLVGVRALIPKPLQQELARTGLSHLIAVSGYNLTIIAQAGRRITGRLGYNASFVLTLWLIGGFVVLTGAAASIVRAAIMAVLLLVAERSGRRIPPLNLLLVAAAVTVAWQPRYLLDLGWLLSFVAFFGIAIMAPAVEERLGWGDRPATLGGPLPGRRETWRRVWAKLLIESTCAQLLTLPLIMYAFDQLSIVSPLANLIILPLVPLAMCLGLIAGVAGMIVPAFCGWLAWPAMLLVEGILWLIDRCDQLPWSSLQRSLTAPEAIIAYLIIGALTLVLQRRHWWLADRSRAEELPSGII